MRRVRSAFVAEVLDADVTGEFPYIVTRYVPGPTLEAMVRSRGPLSGSGLRRLAYGTAEALTAIHAAGVVHRDLKPGNVMLTDDRPVVIDFGIAQSPDATRLTQTGLVMGTPGYLAPEVIEGQPSSPASDVHSWGATMAFAATGRPPLRRRWRLLPDDLLPHRLRPRRPVRRPRAARAAAVRGAGPGPGPPPVGQLAERPGQRPGPVRGRPGRDRRPDGQELAPAKTGRPPRPPRPARPGLSRAQAGRPGRRRPAPPRSATPPPRRPPVPPQPPPSPSPRPPRQPSRRRQPRHGPDHHGRPGHHDRRRGADPDPPGGRPGRVAGRDHLAPGGRPGAERAGRAPVGARAAGQRPAGRWRSPRRWPWPGRCSPRR